MNSADRPRFAAAMTALADYYGKPFAKGVIDLYWQGLIAYEIADVERAIGQHLRNPDNGQFQPKISDLVKLIEGSTNERAAIAWSKVRHAVRCVGPYQSLVFDDPLIHVVIENMGGFVLLCDMKTDDMPFRQQEFEKGYRAYAARGEVPEYLPKLVGISEADCRARGFLEHIPKPVFIGDEPRARLVLQNGRSTGVSVSTDRPMARLLDFTERRLASPESKAA